MPIINFEGNIVESLTRSPPKPQPMSAKRIFVEMSGFKPLPSVTFAESSGFEKFPDGGEISELSAGFELASFASFAESSDFAVFEAGPSISSLSLSLGFEVGDLSKKAGKCSE